MSATTVKLLRVASEIVGGEDVLAKFARGLLKLPDVLLLQAVDIILADRRPAAPVKGNGASHGIRT